MPPRSSSSSKAGKSSSRASRGSSSRTPAEPQSRTPAEPQSRTPPPEAALRTPPPEPVDRAPAEPLSPAPTEPASRAAAQPSVRGPVPVGRLSLVPHSCTWHMRLYQEATLRGWGIPSYELHTLVRGSRTAYQCIVWIGGRRYVSRYCYDSVHQFNAREDVAEVALRNLLLVTGIPCTYVPAQFYERRPSGS